MDCTELVGRYLHDLGISSNVPNFFTGNMASKLTCDGKKNGECYIYFVEGSKDTNFKCIQPGDIFLWYYINKVKNKNGKILQFIKDIPVSL